MKNRVANKLSSASRKLMDARQEAEALGLGEEDLSGFDAINAQIGDLVRELENDKTTLPFLGARVAWDMDGE